MQDLEYALAARETFSDRPSQVILGALGGRLLAEFAKAELERRPTEMRWLQDLRQYRGQYDPEVIDAIGPTRSRAFVRKTRVKVKTVDSRVEDLLFPSGSEKNWEIDSTPVPSLPDEIKSRVIEQLKAMAAQAKQPLTKEVVDKELLKISKASAKKMATVIDDQLTEVAYKRICKMAIHSGHLFGTGIIKGPLVERRVRSTFVNEGGKWIEKSEAYVVPFIDYVPIWRFYPDMGADSLDKCRYVYERHQMTRADLTELAERKSFSRQVIIDYVKASPEGQVTLKYIDSELKMIGERTETQNINDGKYEVLERWGWLTGDDLESIGIQVPQERIHESFFSNVWLLPNGEVIKSVLQPINGVTWPYHIYYLDKDETSIFGDGLATILRDDQTMLNASTRMMLDNGAITSGPMVEVNLALLSNMDDATEMHPWKVFLRNSSNPGVNAVRAIELPSNLPNLSNMADRFETNMDEVSAVPRYMTGENVASGAAGTASGMSMLMGAANIMIKDLIGNWDDGVTTPFIKALYRWNMQFHPDNAIKGDFDVKARGSSSLVAREVRASQLDMFSQAVANPMDAPFIKRDKLLRQRAEAHELSDIVKTEEEVAAETNNEMMQQQQKMQQMQQQLVMAELEKKVALLTAQAGKATAEIELILAKTTAEKVGTIYSSLQAGGAAVTSPHVAPAADEILKSSGFKDATPDPSIAQLGGPPVQTEQIQAPQPMQGPRAGMQQGIETPELDAAV
jgi:hypothetical protein